VTSTKTTWLDFGAGLLLELAPMPNADQIRYLVGLDAGRAEEAIASIQRMADAPGLDGLAGISDEVIRSVARHVLLDWHNLQDAKGDTIPYSQAKAFELLKANPDFLAGVIQMASALKES